MSNLPLEKSFQNVPRRSYNITQPIWKPVKKSMNLKIITFTLILTLFLAPKVHLINAEEDIIPPVEDESIDPVILTMVRTQAENREQEMHQLFGDEIPSEAANSWMHAQQAMEQARNHEEEDPKEAAQLYLRAMRHFRNVLRKYLEENPGTYDTDTLETTTADDDVPEATDEEIIAARKQLLNQFQEQFQERLTEMLKNVDDMQESMSPQDAHKAQQFLIKTEEKLFRIQQRIQAREYEGVLDELEETTQTLDEEFNELEPATAQMLRTMNKLEAKIQKMIHIAAHKAARGDDTSEEDALINVLQGNKDTMKKGFKENNGKGTQGNGNEGNSGN